MKKIIAVALLVLLYGCAAGFDRGAIQQRLAGQSIEVTDSDIQAALEKKSQLRFPMKLAVHLKSVSYHPWHYSSTYVEPAPDWRWTVKDREKIESWAAGLKDSGIVSDIFVLSNVTVTGTDLKAIRLAAAKHGADAVLTIEGVSQVDSYVNALSIFNILILPGWFLPASHRDALIVIRGAMWDVGNEYLYLTVESEGKGETMGPTFKVESEPAIEEAKKAAFSDFEAALITRLKSLKGEGIP